VKKGIAGTMQRTLWKATGLLLVLGGCAALLVLFYGDRNAVSAAKASAGAPYTQWRAYGGSAADAQYSALKQINKSNVKQVKQVWFASAGGNGYRYGSNPIIVDNVIYLIGKNDDIEARNAVTGQLIWAHDNNHPRSMSNRGVTYWESKDRSDRRILYTVSNMLTAIDARTGKTIDSFGDHGLVDLRVGLGRDPKTVREIESPTPGKIFDDLILLGSATGEGYDSPPGDLRAYNVITGKKVWQFHTVPHPGEYGYDTWPKDAWKYVGGTNTWGEISIDRKRGIAYFPLGAPTYDYYGADRHGANLFADCLLALDARTGKYLWHFQDVHHDLWDYDLSAGPKLLTINHDGKKVDVVAEAGKNGFVYVLNRVTGKPIWPIVERSVPQSTMPGEQSWPTQPFPTVIRPFVRQKFTANDVNPYIPNPEREALRQEIAAARKGLFMPPDLKPTVEMPGDLGGADWGSTAIDPTTGTFYVLSNSSTTMIQLRQRSAQMQMSGPPATQGQVVYIQNCLMCHTVSLKGQPPNIPSLVGIVGRLGAQRVKETVQDGSGQMPSFPKLTDEDLSHLIAYLTDPASGHVPARLVTYLMHPPVQPPNLNPGAVRYSSGYNNITSSGGLPAIGPPWSTLTAYDLNTGKIKWQVPFGGVTNLEEKGITNTGSYYPRGGVVVTAGGLIFGGSLSDNTFRAYDKDTGKVLWQVKLPAGPEGIPAVYEIAGKEYVVMSARPQFSGMPREGRAPGGARPVPREGGAPGGMRRGFGGPNSEPSGPVTQGYYAFALPQ